MDCKEIAHLIKCQWMANAVFMVNDSATDGRTQNYREIGSIGSEHGTDRSKMIDHFLVRLQWQTT